MKNKEWTPEQIRALRIELGLTQGQLAEKLGYKSYYIINNWESGRRRPSEQAKMLLDNLKKVVDFNKTCGGNLLTKEE